MTVVQPFPRDRVHDDGAPHAVGEGLQLMKSALNGSLAYADAGKLLSGCLPALFFGGSMDLVNGNHGTVGNGLGLHLFHLHLNEIGGAPFMGPGPAKHGNHIGLDLVLRHDSLGPGNMTAPFSMITAKTGTHFYTIQQRNHSFLSTYYSLIVNYKGIK